MVGGIFKVIINYFSGNIENHDSWEGNFKVLGKGVSAFIDQIDNEGDIVIGGVLFYFHL